MTAEPPPAAARHCNHWHQVGLSLLLSTAVGVTLFVYWPGLYGSFVMDDYTTIRASTLTSFDLASIRNLVTSDHSGILRRPVSVLSLGLTNLAHGLTPFYYKYFNLMLHLLTGLTACWLFGRILTQPAMRLDCRTAWTIATVTTSLWLIHPLLLSTVLYPSQRMAQLSTLFTLTSLLFYVIARERMLRRQSLIPGALLAATTFSAVLAVFSKENGALVAVYLFAIEALLFRFKVRGRAASTMFYGYWLLVLAGGIILAGYLVLFRMDSLFSGYGVRDFTLEQRLMTQCGVLWYYVSLIVFPRLREIGLVHDDYPLTTTPDLAFALAASGLLAAIIAAIVLRTKSPVVALGITWFLVGHLIESTVFPLELVFDHRNYLPAFGILLLASLLIVRLISAAPRTRNLTLFIAILFVSHWGFQTRTQAITWTSLDAMAAVAVQEHPESIRARSEYANRLFHTKQYQQAFVEIDRALALDPANSGMLLHKLVFYCTKPSTPNALIDSAGRSLRNNRLSAYALAGLDKLQTRIATGNCPSLQPAQLIGLLDSALTNSTPPPYFKFFLLMVRARTLAVVGAPHSAFETYSSAFAMREATSPSRRADPLYEMGKLQIDYGMLDQARQTLARLEALAADSTANYDAKIEHLEQLLAEKSVR